MTNDAPPHHRRSIRLQGYDYRQAGAYFITLVTQGRACVFGDIVEGEMQLNEMGQIVRQCWMGIAEHFPHAMVDQFVVMPNHVHGIIVLMDLFDVVAANVGAKNFSPLQNPRGTSRTIGSIVRGFKIGVTKWARNFRAKDFPPHRPVWQRNYYEHIIRNAASLDRIREYILTNPLRWHLDRENPHRTGTEDAWDSLFGPVGTGPRACPRGN